MGADNPPPDQVPDLALLFEQLRPRLLAMVQRRMDPRLWARLGPEDILADAYLLARRRWESFQSGGTVSAHAWLFRITMDCLIEAWRKQSRGRRHPDKEVPWPEQSSLQLGLSLIAPGTSPSMLLARQELHDRLVQILDMLRPRDREILWLRHLDQLKFKEVAEVLDITEAAAQVRYVRALERLRALCAGLNLDEELKL